MNTYLAAIISILVLMHITFIIAIKKKRNDYADVIWGPGFVIATLGAIFWKINFEDGVAWDLRTITVIACISIWALRLFAHIGIRNLKKDEEDIRYKNYRQEWGKGWIFRSYWQVFLLQGFFMFIIVLPAIKIISSESIEIDFLYYLGLAIWILGFLFESIGDHQLKKFGSDPFNKGKIMDRGLWSWSRHPNYFGEVTQWWGVFIIVASLPGAWFTILSPLTITWLILKVSGVPMMEKLMENRPGFAEYKTRVSIFFPRPPKK